MDNKIFLVTVIKFGYKYGNIKRSKDGYFHSYFKRTNKNQREMFTILSSRTFGWYSKLKDAQICVESNNGDIYEGEFDYALIEEVSEGILCGCELPKEWWYKWEGDWDTGKYIPVDKPTEYNNIIGFYDRINKRNQEEFVFKKIENIQIPEFWKEEGVEEPNRIAKTNAKIVCTIIKDYLNVEPAFIATTKENGVYISLKINDRYSMFIETYNDNDIGFILTDNIDERIIANEDILNYNFENVISLINNLGGK